MLLRGYIYRRPVERRRNDLFQQQRETHSHQKPELVRDELQDTGPPANIQQSSTGFRVDN